MDTQIEAQLDFHDGYEYLSWRFSLTVKEYELLSKEFQIYDDWIISLFKGLAPLSSYSDQRDADEYYLARRMIRTDNSYAGQFERPGGRSYYEDVPYHFSLCKMGDDDFQDEPPEPEPFRTLSNLITSPLGEEFGLGYRVLPMTARIIDRNYSS